MLPVRGSNFGIITFIRQRDAGFSIEREIASKALTLGGTLITRIAVGAGNWIFVKNSIKIQGGTMETNLSL